MDPQKSRPRVGLVLSGGGSRGAYEAGVIQYLREDLPKRLGRHVPLDVVTGTSVGAINATFVAATNDDPVAQSRRLVAAWHALRIEQLIGLKMTDLMRAARLLVGGDPPPPTPGTYRYGGLLETSGLERFVVQAIPWRNIERNLRAGHVHALSISATHVGTGHTVVYVSSREPVPPGGWSRDPFIEHRTARIGPRHVLASAAIPMLFPAVKIGADFYTDGGLRQNTPMSPALRLGADRVLVVSLRHVASESEALQRERTAAYPKPLFLMGKALNALLLDRTDYDLDRMQRLNAILRAGETAFGPSFMEVMNTELRRLRGAPLRVIEAVHVRPSLDIGSLAAEFVAQGRALVEGRVARRLLRRLGAGEASHESDLLSYLLFDGNWARELIALGRADAARLEDELVRFFTFDEDA
ncbi:MAG: patatin-like phospholipase family protein, partial [Myxococcales bacterium]|nr:patatin-like phospholipase family protein [Myxococcales bacterium]